MENYLKGPEPNKKCALCRAPINFDDNFFDPFYQGDDDMEMAAEPQMEALQMEEAIVAAEAEAEAA